jgi:hypothetical protein
MRSNQQPTGSATRSVEDRSASSRDLTKLSMPQPPVDKPKMPVDMPRMPVEWLDAGSWRLPSGKALAEFALQAGFLAPLLFRADRLVNSSSSPNTRSPETAGSLARGKQFDKGDGR